MTEVLVYLSGVCMAGLLLCIWSRVALDEKPKDWDVVWMIMLGTMALGSWFTFLLVLFVHLSLRYVVELLETKLGGVTPAEFLTRERPLFGDSDNLE